MPFGDKDMPKPVLECQESHLGHLQGFFSPLVSKQPIQLKQITVIIIHITHIQGISFRGTWIIIQVTRTSNKGQNQGETTGLRLRYWGLMHTPKVKTKPVTKGSVGYNSRAIRGHYSPCSLGGSHSSKTATPRIAPQLSGLPPATFGPHTLVDSPPNFPLLILISQCLCSREFPWSPCWLWHLLGCILQASKPYTYPSLRLKKEPGVSNRDLSVLMGTGILRVWSKVLEWYPTVCGRWQAGHGVMGNSTRQKRTYINPS